MREARDAPERDRRQAPAAGRSEAATVRAADCEGRAGFGRKGDLP